MSEGGVEINAEANSNTVVPNLIHPRIHWNLIWMSDALGSGAESYTKPSWRNLGKAGSVGCRYRSPDKNLLQLSLVKYGAFSLDSCSSH